MRRKRSTLSVIAETALLLFLARPADAADFPAQAAEWKNVLTHKIMPYWLNTAQDTVNGGYLLADDAVQKPGPPREKQLVTQSRMLWGFSHAHRKGLSDATHDYLKAAEQGYRFLTAHFLDSQNGGYYWTTDLEGKVTNNRKIIYGESFVIYGLVEYYRASGDKNALRHALDLYQTLQQHAHDKKHGGWIEHFERDWQPLALRDPHG